MSKAMRFTVGLSVCSMLLGCGADAQQGVVSPVRDDPGAVYARAEATPGDGRTIAQAPAYDPPATPLDVPGRYHLRLGGSWDYLLPSGGVVMTCALRAAGCSTAARGP